MLIKRFFFYCCLLFMAMPAWAQESNPQDYFKESGVLLGYGSSEVKSKDDYQTFSLAYRFGVDMDKMELGYCDWIERAARAWFNKDFHPRGYTEFIIEPFVSYVPQPDTNAEFGLVLLSKFAYPITDWFHPYIFGGGGVMYITQHLREQSTQYNFTPQVGAGASFFLKENMALDVEWRWRHFSNADLKEPNDGVNINMIFAGISWFY